jgi:uncharacterized protein
MRYLQHLVTQDLQKKMVLLGGPRQCGKTTFAKSIGKSFDAPTYLNWDFERDRKTVQKLAWDEASDIVILDELHKRPRWKTWLKGVFDEMHDQHKFLVTGSARLDLYRKGGDSMLGRYHYWRLHPFSLSELPPKMTQKEALHRLMTVGGFPEPFFDGNERNANRWRRERIDRVVRDDVRDLEHIQEIGSLQMFVDALCTRVSGLVVLSNIASDLQVSPKTLKRWLDVLESMYLVFAVRPYTRNLPRAVQKPPKVFFYDNGDVDGDDGARFENLVASHLLKELQFREDATGDRWNLHYVRDKEKHEVDFVTTRNGVVDQLIEAKWADAEVSPHLAYFASKLKPKNGCRQIVGQLPARRAGKFGGTVVQSVFDAFPQLASMKL